VGLQSPVEKEISGTAAPPDRGPVKMEGPLMLFYQKREAASTNGEDSGNKVSAENFNRPLKVDLATKTIRKKRESLRTCLWGEGLKKKNGDSFQ